jgi:hypothetical protein
VVCFCQSQTNKRISYYYYCYLFGTLLCVRAASGWRFAVGASPAEVAEAAEAAAEEAPLRVPLPHHHHHHRLAHEHHLLHYDNF